eukprot:7437664-Lingulodinium_polyedra.AAC.1
MVQKPYVGTRLAGSPARLDPTTLRNALQRALNCPTGRSNPSRTQPLPMHFLQNPRPPRTQTNPAA